MRTAWVPEGVFALLLKGLQLPNRVCLEICERHGCRVSDVLSMRTSDLYKKRWNYREMKTGKRRTVTLTARERTACARIAGRVYVFEHRLDPLRHRTRQAVWKDLQKVAKFVGLRQIGTHTARKVYAVALRERGYTDAQIQRRMNHADELVTMLYAYADVKTQRINKKTLDKFAQI